MICRMMSHLKHNVIVNADGRWEWVESPETGYSCYKIAALKPKRNRFF